MANLYNVGGVARCADTITVAGIATDPLTLTLKVKHPGGTEDTYTLAQLTKDATGQYHYDVTPDAPGAWVYSFTSTSPQSAAEGTFFVRRQES
jgi:hypothetical protein